MDDRPSRGGAVERQAVNKEKGEESLKSIAHSISNAIQGEEKWKWRSALITIVLCAFILEMAPVLGRAAAKNQGPDPWTSAQLLQPAELAKELKSAHPPVVIQVGVWNLYRRGHVPGALYAGPASEPGGLERLGSELKSLSRSRVLVIYCGCCPVNFCPNIRPAFKLAKKLGFTKMKVLYLPNDFGKDWEQKGYPVEKSGM